MPVAGVAAGLGPERVDAARRVENAGSAQIGRGEADGAAAAVARDHVAVQLPMAAENRGQRRDLAGGQQAARPARRMDFRARAGGLDAGHADAERGAHLGQQRDIARTPAAEREVVTDDDVAGADPRRHHVRDEGRGLASGEGAVEPRDVENLDTEVSEVPCLDAEGCEPEGLVGRRQHLARVRLEGEHGERRPEGAGDALAFFDDGAVAQVDAVEVADGDHRAPRVCGR